MIAAMRPRSFEPPPGHVALTAAPPPVTVLTLPFDGVWGVVQGFDMGTHVGYAAYALDFVPAEPLAGAVPPQRRRRLSDHPCFGRVLTSPAEGTVVAARGDAPDWPPSSRRRRPDGGNYVIVQHTPDELSELRHLKRNSVLVKPGDRVTRGQPLGQCGNSGNATTPHVHLALLGSMAPIATRPIRLARYEVLSPAGRWIAEQGVPRLGALVRRTP